MGCGRWWMEVKRGRYKGEKLERGEGERSRVFAVFSKIFYSEGGGGFWVLNVRRTCVPVWPADNFFAVYAYARCRSSRQYMRMLEKKKCIERNPITLSSRPLSLGTYLVTVHLGAYLFAIHPRHFVSARHHHHHHHRRYSLRLLNTHDLCIPWTGEFRRLFAFV